MQPMHMTSLIEKVRSAASVQCPDFKKQRGTIVACPALRHWAALCPIDDALSTAASLDDVSPA